MVNAVVLAAGMSSRMQTPKQLLDFKGRTLLRNVLENLLQAKVDEITVVLGHQAEEVAKTLAGLPIKLVVNNRYREGLSTSITEGLGSVVSAAASEQPFGVLFVLGDQPLVRRETIDLLISHYRGGAGIVAPFYQGKRGNPVLFDRRYFAEIMELKGDQGARELINCHPDDLVKVEVSDRGVITDVDTWQDYLELDSHE